MPHVISGYFKQEGAGAVDADGKVWQKLESVGELISREQKAYQLLNDRFWRIVLKKSFWGNERNFSHMRQGELGRHGPLLISSGLVRCSESDQSTSPACN